jgi:hypothetical protein
MNHKVPVRLVCVRIAQAERQDAHGNSFTNFRGASSRSGSVAFTGCLQRPQL